MPTVTEYIRNRLYTQAGLIPIPPAPFQHMTYEELRAQECSDNFAELMDNRLTMGLLRYGPLASHRPYLDDAKKAIARIEKYIETGNTEFLVDAANYCRLELRRGQHVNKHFHAHDR